MMDKQEIMQRLKQGVQEVFESDKYKEYLRFMASMHPYSFYNLLLLMSQMPEASYVAPYKTWQKLGRQVRKGEKALTVVVPLVLPETDEQGDSYVRVSFRARACVFDVSQTSGEELPSFCNRLVGGIDNPALLDIIAGTSPVPVTYKHISGTANGYFSPRDLEIVIEEDMSDLMKARCLIHEIAHAHLHGRQCPEENTDRRTQEVQAESVSYAVSTYLGLDVSEYSFSYIASWSKDKTLPELRSSMERIRAVTDDIIKTIEQSMNPEVENV